MARKRSGITRYSDGSWGVDYRHNGHRVRAKIGSYDEACAYLAEIQRRQRVGDVLPDKRSRTTVGDLLRAYLARATNKDSIAAANRWIDWLGALAPDDVTEDVLAEWIRGSRWVQRGATALAAPLGSRDRTLRLVGRVRVGDQLELAGERLEVVAIDGAIVVDKRARAQALPAGEPVTVHRRLAEASLYRWLAPLSAAFAMGVERGLCRKNPVAKREALGLERLRNRRYKELLPEQQEALRAALGAWWPYVEFAIVTGMRWGNQFRLRWPDLQLERRRLVLPTSKSGQQLPIPLSAYACQLLTQQLERHPSSPWCWPTVTGAAWTASNWRKRVWVPACERAGLEGLWWHDLRRTAASRLISEGHSLFAIKELLGHESAQTTERHYARLADRSLVAAQDHLVGTLRAETTQGD